MLRTYLGSCYCRLVRFEARIDLDNGTSKCNCSYCSKLRFWHVPVRREDFRLLSDESALTDYEGKNPVAHHPFCKQCGVHVFDRVDTPNGTGYPYVNVNTQSDAIRLYGNSDIRATFSKFRSSPKRIN